MGAMPWPDGASDKQPTSTRVPMHNTGAQCPVHQEETAMGAMPWLVEAEPDTGRESNRPRPWHLDMAWAHSSVWGRHTDAAWTAIIPAVQSGSEQLHHHLGRNCKASLLNRTPAALREGERKERKRISECLGCKHHPLAQGTILYLVEQAPEMAGGSAMEALRERMTQLEEALGEWPRDDGTVTSWAENTMGEIQLQRNMLESHDNFVEEKMAEFKTEMQSRIDEFKVTLQTYGEDIAVLKKAVLQGSASGPEAPSKVRVPEPKGFNGNRNAKELENFLWDIEQFFKAAHVPDGEKVSITSMYLTGDAKLWWRTRMEDDAESGRPQITTWETLKKELKDQFLPTNTAWVAREALKRSGTPDL
ncbi:hypothetical protein CK203_108278 [Vitis vinifera]|uniref:Retrotransposon gag domain-containing protein n=1 Tax=Vitis vinifera TaxID=29760 RepID=A0A438FFQ9_VITVI|nr:hypothetical protein CK203_108278 [Vitis vinifera]